MTGVQSGFCRRNFQGVLLLIIPSTYDANPLQGCFNQYVPGTHLYTFPPVIQKEDSDIHRIKHYPVDKH